MGMRRWWTMPLGVAVRAAPEARGAIESDVQAWSDNLSGAHLPTGIAAVPLLASRYPEFRNVLYMRLRSSGRRGRLVQSALRRLYRPLPLLLIDAERVGPGFFIQHGFATIIVADTIGANCWINQQVTVGYRSHDDPGRPVIGDNVRVGAGAKILGSVTVGDGAQIGANAVVVRDVPAKGTVVPVVRFLDH